MIRWLIRVWNAMAVALLLVLIVRHQAFWFDWVMMVAVVAVHVHMEFGWAKR